MELPLTHLHTTATFLAKTDNIAFNNNAIKFLDRTLSNDRSDKQSAVESAMRNTSTKRRT